MQTHEDDLDDRYLFFRMQPDRDAASVIVDTDRAVAVQRDLDAAAKAGEDLVGRVVDRFLDDVQRTVGPRVHARPLPYRLEALEYPDRSLAVLGAALRCSTDLVLHPHPTSYPQWLWKAMLKQPAKPRHDSIAPG